MYSPVVIVVVAVVAVVIACFHNFSDHIADKIRQQAAGAAKFMCALKYELRHIVLQDGPAGRTSGVCVGARFCEDLVVNEVAKYFWRAF